MLDIAIGLDFTTINTANIRTHDQITSSPLSPKKGTWVDALSMEMLMPSSKGRDIVKSLV